MQFREIKIPFEDKRDYIRIIQEKITPLIEDLESNSLIDRFHFIMHENLDLRLEANYEKKIDEIKNKLREYGLNDDLSSEPWSMPEDPEKYGGPRGLDICYRNLEYNSRIIMDLFKFRKKIEEETDEERKRKLLKSYQILNGQFIHYFLIQQGIDNVKEIDIHLSLAKSWAGTVLQNNPNLQRGNPELYNQLIEINNLSLDSNSQ